jgi:hypothetical protein
MQACPEILEAFTSPLRSGSELHNDDIQNVSDCACRARARPVENELHNHETDPALPVLLME